MAYTKDYYSILGLNAPSIGTSAAQTSTGDIRRAYKLALLAAHPDKKSGNNAQGTHTVDEVKEAYTVLADQDNKAEYDNWLLRNPNVIQSAGGSSVQTPSSDFILGLELLDLSDFDVLDPSFAFSQQLAESQTTEDGDSEGQMEWTRACRCGAEKGFKILEEELEDAETRGEKEVLVGCEGCSLWVRVGFEVEMG